MTPDHNIAAAPTSAGVIGLGYVGLPLAVALAEAGLRVVGVDTDHSKVEAVRAGASYIEDVASDHLAALGSRLTASTDYSTLTDVEVVVISVPTPLDRNREPDLGPLTAATRSLAQVLRAGQLVVLESTTFPGTTRERLAPMLEESGLAAGDDFSVGFSPERVDPGRTDYTIRTTPKIVSGLTPRCLARVVAFYGEICDTLIPVATPEAAELAKLLENVFRSVNIALVNELAVLCDGMNIDVWEVVEAAATKPYGFMSFRPGPGLGGHCLPVDPFYLSWRAREFGLTAHFVELAGNVNQRMPRFCVERITRSLNEQARPVNGSRIAIIGVAYKPGVGDLRESPALPIMRELVDLGAIVSYHDDHVPEIGELGLRAQPLVEILENSDVAVIVTAHPELDLDAVIEAAPLVVDFRGVTHQMGKPNIIRL